MAVLWWRPGPALRWNLPILLTDLLFALLLIAFSGGARSTLFLALLLIAGLQSYYYGMLRGMAVAAVAAAGYVAVAWPDLSQIEVANMVLRVVVLVGTALGVGLLGQVEEAERLAVHRLTTEAHSLERSARQSEKLAALGTLAAGLAHELNNPIGIISSRIEIMLLEAESQPLPAEVTEDLRVLHRHAQRVARIAQGLLSFARQSSGQRATRRPEPGGGGDAAPDREADESRTTSASRGRSRPRSRRCSATSTRCSRSC